METILGDTVALIRQKSFCFSAFLFAFWKKKILSDKEKTSEMHTTKSSITIIK